MSELDSKALEAAIEAWATAWISAHTSGRFSVRAAITAYLSALPAPATQEVDELRDARAAGVREGLQRAAALMERAGELTSANGIRALPTHAVPPIPLELHEDTARLDWLEMQEVIIPNKFRVWLTPSDLRAQIDRARAAEKDKG